MEYNNHPHPIPINQPKPAAVPISIDNIFQYRIALEQIKDRSPEMKGALLNLDTIIHNFTKSLNFGAK
jgi:hypothetical protein